MRNVHMIRDRSNAVAEISFPGDAETLSLTVTGIGATRTMRREGNVRRTIHESASRMTYRSQFVRQCFMLRMASQERT